MGSGQMMPELGSRISLISKADIRYEGRLFTVDPQECTIALANVRSFGTEDRDTAYPIMPQPTVYDYILFRGSDIKDIRVVNNVAIPNDPAIMQMQMNQQPGFPPQQQMQSGAGPMGAQFGPFGNIQGPPMGQNIPPQQQQQQPPPQQNQVQSPQQAQQPSQTQSSPQQQSLSQQQDSRSATPNQSRKSPTSEMGVQTSQQQRENQGANKDKMQRTNTNNNQRNNNQQRRDNDGYRNQRMQPNHQPQQQQQRGGYNNNKNRGSGRMPMMRGPPQPHQNNYRQNSNNSNNPQNNRQNKPPNKPLKFENEFDFEKANSKFEEIRSEFSKLKVGSEENKNPEQQVNGELEKKDDSGNETSADHDQQEGDDYNGYDKTKSFFDNISCEANERSKGKTQRTDWRQERKINSETFGLSMNRRGGMRGRGGYYRNQYGRPMNNYRGGGGGQQYRNNNNRNRSHPQQQGGRPNNINQGSQVTAAATADK